MGSFVDGKLCCLSKPANCRQQQVDPLVTAVHLEELATAGQLEEGMLRHQQDNRLVAAGQLEEGMLHSLPESAICQRQQQEDRSVAAG